MPVRKLWAPSLCVCGGTGVDPAAFQLPQFTSILSRMHDLDRQQVAALRAREILSRTTIPDGQMSKQGWSELIAWATQDGTAVNTTTSETIIMPNITIPGNYMQDGRSMRLRVKGKYGTLGSGTVTHVYKIRWGGVGGTVLCTTGTVTLLISQTNAYWELEVDLQTRSNGISGTILADGHVKVFSGTAPTIGSATGAPAIAPLTAGGQTAPAAVTCDLNADTALAITITHGASSGSNTITGMHETLESMN